MPIITDEEPDQLSSFHSHLEELLQKQIKERPDSTELRLRLIELYFETGRKDAFLLEAHRISRGIADRSRSREWQKVRALGQVLTPDESLFQEAGATGVLDEAATKATPKFRRFGDDAIYTQHFEALAREYDAARADPKFLAELDLELIRIAGRPSALHHASRVSAARGGAQIYFKREDLTPTGSHLMINTLGQALLARRTGRKLLVCSTKNGRRGVVAASVAARLGLGCRIFMDRAEMARQPSNLFRMRLLGADVIGVDSASFKDGDVRVAALEHWRKTSHESFLVVGLDAAPHPYPLMNREFTAGIGRECRRQVLAHAKRPPDVVVARCGNNADAIGLFGPFLGEAGTRLVGVNVRQEFTAIQTLRDEAVRLRGNLYHTGAPTLNRSERQLASGILEGLEYPSVAREQAWLKSTGRVDYVEVTDADAKAAIAECGRLEGLIPAIQTAQVLAWTFKAAAALKKDQVIVVATAENVDKDLWEIGRVMGVPL